MQPIEQTVLAPAKVNLYLCVVGRRADGYHLLDSLLAPISLYDELHIRLGPGATTADAPTISVSCDSESAPGGPANLAYRAAALFLKTVQRPVAVNIDVAKRIPVGSGLGGGSSDAAAVLLTLNRLLGTPLTEQQLASLAAEIGADVPFFIYGRPARLEGAGEQVTAVRMPMPIWLVVCSDGHPLSTALVYSHVTPASLTMGFPETTIRDLVSGRKSISELLRNDLEAAAARIHPEVLSLKAKLMEQGALGALMTGSGSAVFGVWPDSQSAGGAAQTLRAQGVWAEAVHTLDASPASGV